MSDFTELEVWGRARVFTRDVYVATTGFPSAERYGLTSQLRRAANAIGANLAEGSGRPTRRDYRRFVGIAPGSVSEVEHHLIMANDLAHLSEDRYRELRIEARSIRRMLSALWNALD